MHIDDRGERGLPKIGSGDDPGNVMAQDKIDFLILIDMRQL